MMESEIERKEPCPIHWPCYHVVGECRETNPSGIIEVELDEEISTKSSREVNTHCEVCGFPTRTGECNYCDFWSLLAGLWAQARRDGKHWRVWSLATVILIYLKEYYGSKCETQV